VSSPKVSVGDLVYQFEHVDGEGVFEIPVGPVHAGIIGPGHFRFSVAGEPVINLELRLGFTHRGVEKLFETKPAADCIGLAERVSGDSSVAHSTAYCRAIEKIAHGHETGTAVPEKAVVLRSIYLELERMYNHVNDVGGIAVDVGFTFPSAYASIIKENLLCLNEHLSGSRFLKGVNIIGGVTKDIIGDKQDDLVKTLDVIMTDFNELTEMLYASASFMDRIETTGILKKEVAMDLGVTGLASRASGVNLDLRPVFSDVYTKAGFNPVIRQGGDVAARFNVRIHEFIESARMIKEFVRMLEPGKTCSDNVSILPDKYALGHAEGWRGPVLYWVKTNKDGLIDRCKIVDASFHNWQGLAYAVPGNIVPDFPLCNKSFDLSYSGNDL
jgi:Ni,Fe-hydrogenase III large subunit